MQTLKAIYKEGKIHLLSPLKNVQEANLIIVVLDDDAQADISNNSCKITASEEDFQTIGLVNFFDTEDDVAVDWNALFYISNKQLA